jgi:hypothetical protein
MGRDEYHQWLSAHTTKAYKKYGIDPYGVRDVAAKIRDQLQDAEVPHFDEEMCTSFEDLIRDAAELDVDLRMCRAWFLIFMYNEDETRFGDTGSWNRHGMEFRPSDWMEEVEMEEVGETSSSPVALVVSPALIKRGNSSGSNYDQGLTIANRAVLRCKG